VKRISVVLLLLTCVWTACVKKTNSSPDVSQPLGMHAKLNGVAWTAEFVTPAGVYGSGVYTIGFNGFDSVSKEALYFELAPFSGKGVHNLTTNGADKAYYLYVPGGIGYPTPVYATAGQVTITAASGGRVQGTFYFTAGSKIVTDGTFNFSM
jgi:uncharacterized protein DUF6252